MSDVVINLKDELHEPFMRIHLASLNETTFLGVRTAKNPLDAWVLQEIIWQRKPEYIVEVGSLDGGSALYYAMVLDAIGAGKVLTVDQGFVEPRHKRVSALQGDCKEVFGDVKDRVATSDRVMVILDCNHTEEHVFEELQTYGNLTSPGQYLVVEDTTLEMEIDQAMKAVRRWLPKNPDFSPDFTREKYGLTHNRSGYLWRYPA